MKTTEISDRPRVRVKTAGRPLRRLLPWLGLLSALAADPNPAYSESLTIEAAEVWENWRFPSGALRLTDGVLRPRRFGKGIDAAADAAVRAAGSNAADAAALIDGDPATGWAPEPGALLEDQWVEIDLQQVLPVRRVTVRFAEAAPPVEFFRVSLSDGERFINSANVLVEGTVRYGQAQRFAFNEAHEVTLELEEAQVRVLRLELTRRPPAAARVVEIEVEALGDNVAHDLIERGGSVEVTAEIVALAGNPAVMFDGDVATAWRVNPLSKGSTRGSETFSDYRIDLGASYRIDTILLFGDPVAIQPRSRQFYANFLAYDILHSDGSLAVDGSLRWQVLASLPGDQRNLLEVRNFRHEFDPVAVRHLRLRYPTSIDGGIIGGGRGSFGLRLDGLGYVAEFQIFGLGHPARVQLESPVLDLGASWNVNALSWEAEVPAGAQVVLRSRSGDTVEEETHYYDSKGKEVTKRRYEKLITQFRGPVETRIRPGAGWSTWSEAYLEPGEAFRSPSPRRYLQLEAQLLSHDPEAAAALRSVRVDFTRPLATVAVAEIGPQRVEAGATQTFSYFLRPTFGGRTLGFDGLVIESQVPMVFRDLAVDGRPVDGVEHETTERGFRLRLPDPVAAAGLLEVRFDATVFRRTRFLGILEHGGTGQQQAVDPGDAADQVDGDTDVVSLPTDADLLSNLDLSSSVFSPNGDGRHDEVVVSFDALRLTSARAIRVTVYDLHGRRLRRLERRGGAGHYDIAWDGRDGSGRVVPPGLYLLRAEIEGDAALPTGTRLVGVAY